MGSDRLRFDDTPEQGARRWRALVDRIAALEIEAPGAAAASTADTIQILTSQILSGHKCICTDGAGRAQLASPQAGALSVIGVSTGAALLGALVTVATKGLLIEPTWTWGGGLLWLGANGALTQTPPTSGYLVCMGTVVSPTSIIVNPRLVAQL